MIDLMDFRISVNASHIIVTHIECEEILTENQMTTFVGRVVSLIEKHVCPSPGK